MSIKISKFRTVPAKKYDKIHLKRLELTQRSQQNDIEDPFYSLEFEYSTYGVEGVTRYYEPKTKTIVIDDFFTVAKAKARGSSKKDKHLLKAIKAIEHAVAKIIEDKTELGTATVSQEE